MTASHSHHELLERYASWGAQRLLEIEPMLLKEARLQFADAEWLAQHGVVYLDQGFGKEMGRANSKAGRAARDGLLDLGLLIRFDHDCGAQGTNSYYLINGAIAFVVRDAEGAIVQLPARRVGRGHRQRALSDPNHDLDVAPPWPWTEIWNRSGLESSAETVFLTESIPSALALQWLGMDAATALFDSNPEAGLTDVHCRTFAELNIRRVYLAYPAEPRYNRASIRHAEMLAEFGIEAQRLRLPHAMALTDIVTKQGTAARDRLAHIIEQSELLGRPTRTRSTDEDDLPVAEPVREGSALTQDPETGEVEVVYGGDRYWRVGGLDRNRDYDRLAVALHLLVGDRRYDDRVDLYRKPKLKRFIEAAAEETGLAEEILTVDLGRLTTELEMLQRDRLAGENDDGPPVMTEADRVEALELLEAPDLVDRIRADLGRVGIVGEAGNGLLLYLIGTSRLLRSPLSAIVQSASAAGKTSLMDAVLSMLPSEEHRRVTALSGKSLFYRAEHDLAHKVLAVAEEEGAERAEYALKLLISDGELTMSSTIADKRTGRLMAEDYHVQGPVALILTTTALAVDDELENRCLRLVLDASAGQTRRIHERQRLLQTAAGLDVLEEAETVAGLHRNAQRLLEPIEVVNPFALELGFMDAPPRTRRDHLKFLQLTNAIALLHQHQRPVREYRTKRGAVIRYIEVIPDDLELAVELIRPVVRESLQDLPPQTRDLLATLVQVYHGIAEEFGVHPIEVKMSRRDLRERDEVAIGDTQLKLHLGRLVEMEYLAAESGEYGRRFYRLLDDGQGLTARIERRLANLGVPTVGEGAHV